MPRVTIAVVIPCYRVRKHVLAVLAAIGPECSRIYVVDDACPEQTGELVESECHDPRVRVLRSERNQGVGGATLLGVRAALADGADVIVKLDGDGQMDPALVPRLVQPILAGEADYAKGNRFFDLDGLGSMPRARVLGNSLLSFASKLSSGYWNVFDPTNGFTAIHAAVARQLPLGKIATAGSSSRTSCSGSARSAPSCATCRCRPSTRASAATSRRGASCRRSCAGIW
jgi:glycosyltransferase involved in cell wall biosynthesis